MLLNDLFIVDDQQSGVGTLTALLHITLPHRILDGHFPGRPVLPGACLVQLVAELAAPVAGCNVQMIRADQVKFIAMIDPVKDGKLTMTLTGKEITAAEWQIAAEGSNAGTVCFRFKGIFRAE